MEPLSLKHLAGCILDTMDSELPFPLPNQMEELKYTNQIKILFLNIAFSLLDSNICIGIPVGNHVEPKIPDKMPFPHFTDWEFIRKRW